VAVQRLYFWMPWSVLEFERNAVDVINGHLTGDVPRTLELNRKTWTLDLRALRPGFPVHKFLPNGNIGHWSCAAGSIRNA